MIWFVITSIFLVVSFVGITIWKTKALPDSISAMVYSLPQGAWQWSWTIWLVLVAIFTFAPMIDVLDTKFDCAYFGFLTMACLFFVAVFPLFQVETRMWHYILGVIGGIMSQVCVFVLCPWWLLLWVLFLAYGYLMAYKTYKWLDYLVGKGVFVAETICYLTVICSEIVH